jgi:hypothetical protein
MYAIDSKQVSSKKVRVTISGMRFVALSMFIGHLFLTLRCALPAFINGHLSHFQFIGGLGLICAGVLLSMTVINMVTHVPRDYDERQRQFEQVLCLMLVNAFMYVGYGLFW